VVLDYISTHRHLPPSIEIANGMQRREKREHHDDCEQRDLDRALRLQYCLRI
jgi:hypothetical protein